MRKMYLTMMLITLMSMYNSVTLTAQDSTSTQKIGLDISCDMMSRYVWRGSQFGGNSPSIQPGVAMNYKFLTFGVWGAYSTGGINASQEVDLYLSANFFNDKFTAVVTDYYFPSNTINYDYFAYGDKTGHVLEAGLLFNGTDKIPFSFGAYLNFYGNDAHKTGNNPSDTTTFNKNIGNQYSTYFELAYNKSFNNMDLSAFVGFTLTNQKSADKAIGYDGETGFYGSGAGVVNLGVTLSKGVQITKKYSLPLTASFIINPNAEKVYLVFGFSF